MADSRAEAEKVQDKPGNLVVSESMEMTKEWWGHVKKGFNWPNLGQFEHQNKYVYWIKTNWIKWIYESILPLINKCINGKKGKSLQENVLINVGEMTKRFTTIIVVKGKWHQWRLKLLS